jgi:pimeloyl-ACP methyl ester carboxylesterase
LGGTPEVWRAVIDQLDPSVEVVNVELPWSGRQGSGWSARPASEWVRRAILDVRTPACVVAHSFGANAVLEYLDAHGAEAIDRIALVCPFYDAAGAGVTAEERFSLDNFQRLIEEGFRRQVNARQIPPHILTTMAQRVRERVGLEGWREFLRVFGQTSRLRLGNFTRQSLLLAGENDQAAPTSDVGALAQRLTNATFVRLPGCGHFAITEQPQQIADALHRLLTSPRHGALCAAF